MFTISEIKAEYKRLDELTGMNISSTIPVEISSRCKRTRGRYEWIMNNFTEEVRAEKIVIAKFVLMEGADTFYNTIRHEYAHAMSTRKYGKEGAGHSYLWKECCSIVGCSGERFAKATEQQMEAVKNHVEYKISCSGCGRVWTYRKKGRVVKAFMNGGTLTCPFCKGNNFSMKSNQKGN